MPIQNPITMKIDSAIKEQIILCYPGLDFKTIDDKLIIEGSFQFRASFDAKTKHYIINPPAEDLNTIVDSYQIRIEIQNEDDFPVVYETGGRIPAKSDYHKNPDGSLCLTGPFDSIGNFPLEIFIDTVVLQFFYDQSFYGKYGSWPRGVYSHGILGLLENYFDNLGRFPNLEEHCLERLSKYTDFATYRDVLTSKLRIKGHHLCICGSGRQYKKCHDKVFRGLWHLQRYLYSKLLK
jgi:hypothetical protein